jgi:hypothetical protein
MKKHLLKTLFLLLLSITSFAQIQKVNPGTVPGDGTGDKAHIAFGKINADLDYLDAKVVASGTDSYTAALPYPSYTYVADQEINITFTNANTGASTVNIGSLGIKNLKKSGNTALVSGDIPAGGKLKFIYDGTNFQMMSGSGGGSSFTNPMTTAGDIIVGGASGTPARVAAGSTSGYVLTSNGAGVAPSWQVASGGGGSGWPLSGSFTLSGPTGTGNWTLVGNQTFSGTDKYVIFAPGTTAGGRLKQITTTQGATFGHFYETLNEGYLNSDGQYDAVRMDGYNTNGAGGRVNTGDAEFHTALESHYIGGGTHANGDFEYHLQSLSRNGNTNRHYSINVQKQTGVAQGYSALDVFEWRSTVANGGLYYFAISASSTTSNLTMATPTRAIKFNVDDTNTIFTIAPYTGTFSNGMALNSFSTLSIPNTVVGASGATIPTMTFVGSTENQLISNTASAPFRFSTQAGIIVSGSGGQQYMIRGQFSGSDKAYYSVDFGTAEARLFAAAGGYFHTIYASGVEQLRVSGTSARANSFYSGAVATAPTSTLQSGGSFATGYVAKTGAYTLTISDHTVEVTSGTHSQTLPTAVGITGREYVVTNSGSGTVTLATTSSQTFVNITATPTSLSIAQFHGYYVKSNGANWIVIASF